MAPRHLPREPAGPDRTGGRTTARDPDPEPAGAPSRTCYDHLAGPLGVELYRDLCARDALRPGPDGTTELGPRARSAFAGLGVDIDAAARARRRLAFECLDATEHRPHLAGALGGAVADALFGRGWIERAGGREIRLTAAGAEALGRRRQ